MNLDEMQALLPLSLPPFLLGQCLGFGALDMARDTGHSNLDRMLGHDHAQLAFVVFLVLVVVALGRGPGLDVDFAVACFGGEKEEGREGA
jgi:hypothetical protein